MPDKPLWYWDDSVKRYRNPTTGQFVGIDTMTSLRKEFQESQKSRLAGLTTVMDAGTINMPTYERQVKDIIRQTYIDLYVMGAGGRNNMTQADWGRIGGILREQYKYLDPFMDQIESGELSQAQIVARLKMYINSASESFWRAVSRDMPFELPAYPGDGSTSCLTNCQCEWDITFIPEVGYDCYWRLGAAEHCEDCIERSTTWNPYRIRYDGSGDNVI